MIACKLSLHEAIIQVLQQKSRSMSTQEIADALNRNGLYAKKDDSSISAFQIHGRTCKYDKIFSRVGSIVCLRSNFHTQTPQSPFFKATSISKVAQATQIAQVDHVAQVSEAAHVAEVDSVPVQTLMNSNNFKTAVVSQLHIPNLPGLYCIRVDKPGSLPAPFAQHLKTRNHNILYIGIATTSLRQRLGQELWAEGQGTFFRGLGAVLGYRPPKGSLLQKSNKNNYTFSQSDENAIIRWVNTHLIVNWVTFEGDFKNTETMLIKKSLPLFNSSKNPAKLSELAALRNSCREIAIGK